MTLPQNEDPDALFDAWMAEATESESRDPNAIALATVDQSGCPDVRMVLLKGKDPRGFVFYTNTESAKGQELAANAQAAFVLYWKSLNRQVRVRGSVAPVTDAEADAYFASRHPKSRIGAWASQQSRPLESRARARARGCSCWKSGSAMARSRGPPTGADFASCLSRSNSGPTARRACTIESFFGVKTAAPGRSSGSILETRDT